MLLYKRALQLFYSSIPLLYYFSNFSMIMSCSGCRVLRKGCNESCNIRPCLQWIKSSESQANATLFLAKFYGRTGLINLISSGPDQLRPAIFQSLLYEACGRIVNPISGSTGLMCTGNWNLCEAAVESVLNGSPIAAIADFRAYDIRHVSKDPSPSAERHKIMKNRARFKRSACRTGLSEPVTLESEENAEASNITESDLKTENEDVDAELKLDLTLGLTLPGALLG